MDTGWIQVFVLTLAECVAPAGKTVCQETEFELQFLTQADCEYALEQLVTLKEASDLVIVDRNRSRCVPSARQQTVYANLDEVTESVADKQSFKQPGVEQAAPEPDTSAQSHRARLDSLKTCEETRGQAPCKIGEIIIEETSAGESVEVWRRD